MVESEEGGCVPDGCDRPCSLGGTQDPFISVTIFTLSFSSLSPDWGQAAIQVVPGLYL